jgi:hypothetical protein
MVVILLKTKSSVLAHNIESSVCAVYSVTWWMYIVVLDLVDFGFTSFTPVFHKKILS